MNKQKGFTLIELVTVIVILGILSAVAIPLYYSLQSSARASVINGIYGAVSAAASLANSNFVVSGAVASGTVSADSNGVSILWGYPDSTGIGIGYAAGTNSSTGVNLNANITFTGTTKSNATWQAVGATTPANCEVKYVAATSATVQPVITVVTSGC